MSWRLQCLLGAAACVLAGAGALFGSSPALLVVAAALALTWLVAFPTTALAVMLATISCDQVLTLRVADSVNLRLAHLCALALVVRLGVQRLRMGGRWQLPRRALQPLVAYLALACVGAFASANLAKSVGYLSWAAADVIAVFALLVDLARTEAGFRKVRRAWGAGALIAAAFGLVQLGLGFLHLPVPFAAQRLGAFPRIDGFNYEPAYYALYLESVAAVYLGRFARGGPDSGKALALGAGLLVPAALSMSRSGWLGMALLVAYVSWRALGRLRARPLLVGLAAAGVLGCAALLALPEGFVEQAPRMAAMALDLHEQTSTAPRLGMLGQALRIFGRHPLLGVGLGGYGGYVVEHPELSVDAGATDPARIVTTNLWLEIAAEVGLPAVGVLLWFLASLLRSLWRARRFASPEDAGWIEGLLVSVLLVFGVLYQFNQTLWRLDVWVLLALAWAAVVRARAAVQEAA